jgi:outer membrane lipoprotein SlyB
MKNTIAAAALMTLVAALPTSQAQAQDVLGGALLGGAAGALIGGAATGKAGGAAVGAVIGATTGALIAQEAERRRGGYYWWKGNCYLKRGGEWYRVKRRYCS